MKKYKEKWAMGGVSKFLVMMGAFACISFASMNVMAYNDAKNTEDNLNLSVINESVWVDDFRDMTTGASSSTSGKWIKGGNGKWWYKHGDGSYTKDGWEKINNSWYLFDSSGWMLTGWQKKNDKWYYLGEANDGSMKSGWQKVNGSWYYLGEANDGSMKSGWQKVNGSWYYLGEANDGSMKSGWQYINAHWYYLGDENDGSMKTGWKKILGLWYYFQDSGEMNTTNLVQGSRSYSFHSSGFMTTSIMNIRREKQQRSQWCWAASSVMIGKYGTSSTVSQMDVVQHVKGAEVNESGTDAEVIQAIRYVSKGSKNPKAVPPKSYSDIKDYIDANKLFAVHMAWKKGRGHMLVGAGYSLNNDSIYCIDPWENTVNKYYNYSSLVNGTTISTGTGKCFSLIMY